MKIRKAMKPRTFGDPTIQPHKIDIGKKPPNYPHTSLTLEQRFDLIGDIETAIKTHNVDALPALVARCAGVANGAAMVKRLRDALG